MEEKIKKNRLVEEKIKAEKIKAEKINKVMTLVASDSPIPYIKSA